MATTVYLHIGAPKTGTTYLQAVCNRNRDRLASDGILWPGRTWIDQVRAVRDLLGAHPPERRPPEIEGAWSRLCDEIRRWRGPAALMSMEWLVGARPGHVRRVVQTLAPAEVRIIVTARDLARTIPAQWQESVQNWATWSWEEYLDGVVAPDGAATAAGRRLWTQHNLGPILRTWGAEVPANQMCVITVPQSGAEPGLLWRRFASKLGVNPDTYDATTTEGNASLGVVSAELMRRVNVAAQEHHVDPSAYYTMLKWGLAKRGLSGRRQREPALTLPPEYYSWAERHAKRIITDVAATGVRVVGDLDELLPGSPPAHDGACPADVTSGELLDAALDGIAQMTRSVHPLLPEGGGDRGDLSAWQHARRLVVEMSARSAVVARALRVYRWARRRLHRLRLPYPGPLPLGPLRRHSS